MVNCLFAQRFKSSAKLSNIGSGQGIVCRKCLRGTKMKDIVLAPKGLAVQLEQGNVVLKFHSFRRSEKAFRRTDICEGF